jgi:hypothetical protein
MGGGDYDGAKRRRGRGVEQTGWAKGEVKLGVGHGVMQPARIAIYGSDIAL